MALTRDEAWTLLTDWTKSESLLKHAQAVEIVMKAAAKRYGGEDADEEQWGIAGLLHDADYDQWPETHPDKVVHWLKERDEPELAHAIAAHYTKWGVPYENPLEKALVACDELTGFIVACCLVRPEGVATLKPKSVKKKLKDKAFARSVERDEVHSGIDLLQTDLTEHIQFIIDTLREHADLLGIGPRD
tara:strand:- start:179 stop:745 length:567 start_codon:yes stop_codon:yes gene_type:complete